MSLLSHSLEQIQKPSWFNTLKLTDTTLKNIRAVAAARRQILIDFLKSSDGPQSRSQIMAGCGFELQITRSIIEGCENRGIIRRLRIDGFLHWELVCST